MLNHQPKWVILLAIGSFAGFSFVVLYHLSASLQRAT